MNLTILSILLLAQDPEVEKLRKEVEVLRAELAEVRAQLGQPAKEAPPAPAEARDKFVDTLKHAWDRIDFFGDFRLRTEFDRDRDSQPNRDRYRVRGRLGATYEVNDEIKVGTRLVTHEPGSDPNSTHVTLGGGRGFGHVDADLDRVWARYEPDWLENSFLQVGKFGHPFKMNPVYGELVWDEDVQPEGGAIGYSFKDLGEVLTSVDLKLVEYIAIEQNALDEGTMFGTETVFNFKWSDEVSSFVSGAYYNWANVTPDGSAVVFAQNAGNAVAGGDFSSEFEIVHAIAGTTILIDGMPLTLAGEYFRNFEAAIDEEEGWSAGARLGKFKEQWDWQLYAQYQVVERDAVLSPFAQDDFLLQTNFRGWVGGFKLMLLENVDLNLWVLTAARDDLGLTTITDDDDDQLRWRIDINIKF